MLQIFLISFLVFALIYSLLSITPLFYLSKGADKLDISEMKVRNGTANFTDRFKLFIANLFLSLLFPPIYILSGIATFIVSIFN